MKDIKRLAEHLNYSQLADGPTRQRQSFCCTCRASATWTLFVLFCEEAKIIVVTSYT